MPLLEYIEVLGSIVSSREMSWARIGEFLYEEESFLLERLDTHHCAVNLNIRSASPSSDFTLSSLVTQRVNDLAPVFKPVCLQQGTSAVISSYNRGGQEDTLGGVVALEQILRLACMNPKKIPKV